MKKLYIAALALMFMIGTAYAANVTFNDFTNGTSLQTGDIIPAQRSSAYIKYTPLMIHDYVVGAGLPAANITGNVSGGSSTQIQYNNGSAIAGDANLTWTSGSATLGLTGLQTITATNANALAIGQNGATNPALQIDTSTATSITGLALKSGATGTGVSLTALGGTNESVTISSKGTGGVNLNPGGSNRFSLSSLFQMSGLTSYAYTATANTSGVVSKFTFTGGADTGLTAATESNAAYINMGQIRTHAANNLIATQRDVRVTGSTNAFTTSGGIITNAAAFAVDGPGSAGTNATLTNSSAIYVPSVALTGTVTSGYALNITQPTGATTNGAALINGHVYTTGTTPALATGATDCGTTPAIVGNDLAGRITVGSATNGGKCTITFATAWTNAPICQVFDETTAVALRPVPSTTTLALTGVVVAGDALNYQCTGYR